MPTHRKITPEERARRKEHADGARANAGLEGFKPSRAMEERVRLYIDGDITLAELVDPTNDPPH
ncbi:antitoxin VbhA family protein [Dyella sp.]|uniref:antitoxin VbhA family protein n=1 Tax=Dyella sp. TaxID=1869338 RepID=UPI002ED383FA